MMIRKLRSTNRGIDGTIANAKHHAQAIIPYIEALRHVVPTLPFKIWKQGHNIHQFINKDGRKFELVPLTEKEGTYVGVRFRMYISRKQRITLFDATSTSMIPDLINLMKLMGTPTDPNCVVGGGITQ